MELYISNAGQEPIYAQITRQIKDKILTGELKEGDALPSIRLLAKELRISVITTKRAYEDLEAAGSSPQCPARAVLWPRRTPSCTTRNASNRWRTACRTPWTRRGAAA